MFGADLAFPFTLGLVAAFNPCGFAMLPVYVSFFLGKDADTSTARSIMRALKVGLALTAGFIAVFGAFGVLTSSLLSSGSVLSVTPYITFGLGFLLIPLGVAMYRGYELKISSPRVQKGGDSDEVLSMFMFGVSYAVVSLGCTVGLFIAGVSNVFASGGFLDGVSVFVAYGLGMGAVIMTLTVALALAKTSIATNMRKILPWVNRISGVLLALSGLYLITYGWWEIQVLRDPTEATQNGLIVFFENFQTEVNVWIDQTGATRLGAGLLILVGAALIRGLWGDINREVRAIAITGLVTVWALLEFAQTWNGEQANLFVLPILRTIQGFPARIGNWFTDPIRFGVAGEILLLGVIGLAIYFRVVRTDDDDMLEPDTEELVTA